MKTRIRLNHHHAAAILATGIASLLMPLPAPAAIYYWDTNPATVALGNDFVEGGAGTWDTTTANFTTSATDSSGVTHNVWSSVLNSLGKDTLVFGGAAGGTITLNTFASGGQISSSTTAAVNNLTFNTTGYTITGSNQLRFVNNGATGGAITVAPGIIGTINVGIQGTTSGGLNSTTTGADGAVDTLVDINGGGTLRMGGSNGSIGFAIATGTTVEQTGGGFSGFNLNTINGTLRTQAANVLSGPSSYQDTAGLSTSLLDLSGIGQSISTIGGTLAVTNSTGAASVTLGLSLTANTLVHTGVISNGTGKISLATNGVFALGNGFNSSTGFAQQTFAGSNTYTGSTSLGRGTVVLDFSNAAALATNILYNGGFGTPTGDDGKLVVNRPTTTIGVANSAIGSLATLTLTGKANTTNSQQFNGLKLDTNGGASVLINPNATANTVTLNLGSTIERATGSLINFATTNVTTALSASAIVATTAGTASTTLTDANGVAFATLGGQDWAAKNAGNTALTIATYTAATGTGFTPASNINIGAGNANGANDTRLLANSAITTLRYADTNTRAGVNIGGNTLTTGGILVPVGMNDYGSYLGGGTLTSPGSDVVLIHYNSSSNRQFAVDAVVANGAFGATGFTKGGTGISLLSENNTYTGALTVQQGGLVLTGTNLASGVNINGTQANLNGLQLPAHNTGGAFLQIGYGGTAGTIGTGTVNIGVGSILAAKTSDNITINNTILGIGGFTQGGSGITTLVSAATAKYQYAGETTVTGGTLKLDYSASNTGIISDSSKLVLGGGTIEYATVLGTTTNDAVRETGLIAGATTITKTGTGAGRLRLNAFNDVTIAGATVNFTAANIADTDLSNSNGIMGTRARFTVGGADWGVSATSAADTAITALPSGSYTALISTGTNVANSILTNAGLTLTGTVSTNTLKVDNTSAATQTVDVGAANTLTFAQGGLLITGTDPVAMINGTLKSATGTNSDLIIHQYNAGGLTIGSVIATGNGTSTLTKSGTGPLTLSAANTYTGQTYLNGGTTIIAANAALGAPASGQQINLNDGTLRSTATLGLFNGTIGTNNRNIVVNGVGGTLEVDAGTTLTVGGQISGPGGLTKTGTGTLDVRSTFYTGPTTVTAGTLKYGVGSASNGYSMLTVGAAGTVDIAGGANLIGTLGGSGIVTNSGAAATLTIGGLPFDTTFSGQLTQVTNALNIDKTGAGSLTLTGATSNTTGTYTVSGGSLVLSGAGVLTTLTGTSAGALNLSSATGTLSISAITPTSLSLGSLAGVAGSQVALGGKTLAAGINNGTTTFAGVISGAGGGLTKTASTSGSGNLTLTGVNTYTGPTIVDQGLLRIRDSVLVNTDGPLGNAASAVVLGTASSTVGGSFSTNILLSVQPVGDGDLLTFARPLDFSQAANNVGNTDRNRLRLESNGTGGLDTSKLTVSGALTFGAHSTEFYVDRAGQTIEFTGAASGTGAGTIYFTGVNGAAPTADGVGAGTFRFSNLARSFTQNLQLTVGRMVIDGSVPATGDSPIGRGSVNFSDGNGGNTLGTRGRDSIRSVFLETGGTSFARFVGLGGGSTVTPTAGAQTQYGTGATNLINGEQFGGLNATGTTTFSGGIGGQNVNVSVTGTAGGLGGTNQISVVHNLALSAAAGGTTIFSGAITGAASPTLGSTGTPGPSAQGNNTRVTINQFRNHPNLDEDRDGNADPGVANALVGTATTGTVVLSVANTYGGGTELLGGTARLDHAQGLSTVGNITFTVGTGIVGSVGGTLQYGSGITADLSARIKNSTGGISVDTNGNDVTFASALDSSNSNGLAKSGAGVLTLSAANTYTGATTISGGTLQLGAGGTTGSLAATSGITNNATLAFNRSDSLLQGTDFANAILGTGSIEQSGTGTTTLGANAYSGATTVTAGTLAVTGSLSATTTVNVTGGTLLLGAANVINDAAAVTLGGGTLNTGGFSDTLGSLTLSADSTIDFGVGNASELTFSTLTLGATNNLNIWNWTATNPPSSSDSGTSGDGLRDRLIFTSLGSLSDGELSRIHFFSDSGMNAIADGLQISFGANQEIVPVPEPSAFFAALSLLGLVGLREHRRPRTLRSSI